MRTPSMLTGSRYKLRFPTTSYAEIGSYDSRGCEGSSDAHARSKTHVSIPQYR